MNAGRAQCVRAVVDGGDDDLVRTDYLNVAVTDKSYNEVFCSKNWYTRAPYVSGVQFTES